MAGEKQPTDVKAAEALAKAGQHLLENKDKKFRWADVKDKLTRFGGALIMEKNKKDEWVISIGRVSWWMAFLPALYIFIAAFVGSGGVEDVVTKDITPNHLTILLTLAGYNFGKKVADTVKNVWGKGEDGPG